MHIVGGVYKENCCIPAWDEIYGSGGRAAATISVLSPNTKLHTYVEELANLSSIEKLGIEILTHPRATAISFAYFHPLSSPHIEPPLDQITREQAIEVTADVVLRFGFLEGDAVVNTRRAIYDPQTWKDPTAFTANGSVAEELAIVLNDFELLSAGGADDLNCAAKRLIDEQGANVVIAKGGVRGATVFEKNGRSTFIPAYRSSRVFKIGTGDVFSAVFAHYWGEKGLPAIDAADIASRSVATYCSSAELPLKTKGHIQATPIKYIEAGSVLLDGKINTVGRRYTLEEARFVLNDLGVKVVCPALGEIASGQETAALLIADGLRGTISNNLSQIMTSGKSIIVLQESDSAVCGALIGHPSLTLIDDFTSAIYFAAWAAAEYAG